LTDKILKMKKIIILISSILLVVSCNDYSVSKPDNLIAKDKMAAILYDISLLEAIKAQNINGGISRKTSYNYIYNKYRIDSLQFIKSNKYYASNIEEYKKIIEEVKERLTKETAKAEAQMKKNGQVVPPTTPMPSNPDMPQIQ